jgi:hypothetical protein
MERLFGTFSSVSSPASNKKQPFWTFSKTRLGKQKREKTKNTVCPLTTVAKPPFTGA